MKLRFIIRFVILVIAFAFIVFFYCTTKVDLKSIIQALLPELFGIITTFVIIDWIIEANAEREKKRIKENFYKSFSRPLNILLIEWIRLKNPYLFDEIPKIRSRSSWQEYFSDENTRIEILNRNCSSMDIGNNVPLYEQLHDSIAKFRKELKSLKDIYLPVLDSQELEEIDYYLRDSIVINYLYSMKSQAQTKIILTPIYSYETDEEQDLKFKNNWQANQKDNDTIVSHFITGDYLNTHFNKLNITIENINKFVKSSNYKLLPKFFLLAQEEMEIKHY